MGQGGVSVAIPREPARSCVTIGQSFRWACFHWVCSRRQILGLGRVPTRWSLQRLGRGRCEAGRDWRKGLTGCIAALECADRGHQVDLPKFFGPALLEAVTQSSFVCGRTSLKCRGHISMTPSASARSGTARCSGTHRGTCHWSSPWRQSAWACRDRLTPSGTLRSRRRRTQAAAKVNRAKHRNPPSAAVHRSAALSSYCAAPRGRRSPDRLWRFRRSPSR